MSKAFMLAAVAMATVGTVMAAGPGTPVKPAAADAGLKLPAGFSALKAADSLGHARHIAVTPEGDLYVKLDGTRGRSSAIWYLQDTNNDGKIDKKTRFFKEDGTGIAVKGNYLYASSNTAVYRFKLNERHQVIDTAHAETIVKGLIDRHQHESKSIALDNDGNLYVNIGAYSNACQTKDRTKGSPGMQPCPVLDSAGGIWQFKADKVDQTYGDGVRYATGLRNVVGLDWNQELNQLFVMQHGRDQLHDLWPDMYDEKQSAELPAECMYALHKGSDCGWPYIYYDPFQHRKILAPEFGGDGKKTGPDNIQDPVVAFPAHMAPNALLFYTGNMFPEKYKNGAFIAFHGSWNRAPEPQKGFFVVFQPFKDGKPSGDWEIFAEGFAGAGEIKSPGQAQHRPCGLAQGPDGSLYVSDDVKGTVYRITYKK